MTTTLAIAAAQQRAIFFYLALLVVLVIVLVAAALVLRKIFLGDDEDDGGGSFLLSDLRRLHESGELSDEEFDAARRRMIAQHRAMLAQGSDEKKSPGRADKDGDGEAPAGG